MITGVSQQSTILLDLREDKWEYQYSMVRASHHGLGWAVPIFLSKVVVEHKHTQCYHMVATAAAQELNSSDRECVAWKATPIYYLALTEKFADPLP